MGGRLVQVVVFVVWSESVQRSVGQESLLGVLAN